MKTDKYSIGRYALGVVLMVAVSFPFDPSGAGGLFTPSVAFAKGGDDGDGGGGGNSGSGKDGGGNHGGGGSGNSGSGKGGSGNSGSGKDGGGNSGGGNSGSGNSGSGKSGSGKSGSGNHGNSGRDSGVSSPRRNGGSQNGNSGDVEIHHSNGWVEGIFSGQYVVRDAKNRTVIRRAARPSDIERLKGAKDH